MNRPSRIDEERVALDVFKISQSSPDASNFLCAAKDLLRGFVFAGGFKNGLLNAAILKDGINIDAPCQKVLAILK